MPNVRNEVRDLADMMRAKFTPPDFVPGCLVKSVADKDEYTTNNGWVEAIVGPHGQQRVRYYGEPAGLVVDTSYIDVEYFPAYRLYRVFSLGGGTALAGGVRVSEVWQSDFGGTALSADAAGKVSIGSATADGLLSLVSAAAIGSVLTISGTNTQEIIEVTATNQPSASTQILRFIPTIDPQASPITNVFGVNINPTVGGSTSNNISTLSGILVAGGYGGAYGGTINTRRGLTVSNWTDTSSGSPSVTNQYGIVINELTYGGNNWAIYTLGDTTSFFGASAINLTPEGKIHVEQGNTGAIIPVLFLDQLDVSEPAIIISYDSTDQDMIMMELEVTGTPQFGWDESETAFTLSDSLHFLDGHIEMVEITAPAAGAANSARLFARDNGAGKTQLVVRFNTGAIQVLATEP